MNNKKSYGTILKSTSIMGSTAVIKIALTLVRTKSAANLIGTQGIGVLASLSSLQGVIGTIAGLGIQSSAVKDIAEAAAKNDSNSIGRVISILQRICWITGLAGLGITLILSQLMSLITFGSEKYTHEVMILGVTILLANITGGQMALLQGMRRIGDLARVNLVNAISATVCVIGFYSWLGIQGIIPSLLVTALLELCVSHYFARQIEVKIIKISWKQTFSESSGMIRMGLAFMWNGLMAAATVYITIAMITKVLDIQAVGLYSAALALSGMFINIVLQAMGADYYPRLVGVVHDKKSMSRLVNEQVEIGLLISTPGLLATLIFAPLLIKIFYTQDFITATELMQWFVLAAFGRVVSWPMGFTLISAGKIKWVFTSQILNILFYSVAVAIFIANFSLLGVGVGSLVHVMFSVILNMWIVNRLFSIKLEREVRILLFQCGSILALFFACTKFLDSSYIMKFGIFPVLATSAWCIKEIIERLGSEHYLSIFVNKIPLVRSLFSRKK